MTSDVNWTRNPAVSIRWFFAAMAMVAACDGAEEKELPPLPECRFLKTDKGDRFAVLGEKPAAPAPTLFVFGGDMRNSLIGEDVNRIGRILMPHGWLCVSVDLPAHGWDTRTGEKSGDLGAWKARVVKGEDIVKSFNETFSRVLDYLLAEKFTDPAQVAVSGTSRGGFCAFHAAAADPRVKQVIAFAPVTHLPALAEFQGAETNELALSLSPIHVADKLVGKPMLILIGNDDQRVGTGDCLALGMEVIRKSKGKLNPIPVEVRLVGTIAHRLHAVPTAQYGQLCAPHEEAARWLLLQAPKRSP